MFNTLAKLICFSRTVSIISKHMLTSTISKNIMLHCFWTSCYDIKRIHVFKNKNSHLGIRTADCKTCLFSVELFVKNALSAFGDTVLSVCVWWQSTTLSLETQWLSQCKLILPVIRQIGRWGELLLSSLPTPPCHESTLQSWQHSLEECRSVHRFCSDTA